jgi:hypothetical protein
MMQREVLEFFERHAGLPVPHLAEAYAAVCPGACDAGISRREVACSELLSIYAARAKHLANFGTAYAATLRREVIDLCAELDRNIGHSARFLHVALRDGRMLVLFEDASTSRVLGAMATYEAPPYPTTTGSVCGAHRGAGGAGSISNDDAAPPNSAAAAGGAPGPRCARPGAPRQSRGRSAASRSAERPSGRARQAAMRVSGAPHGRNHMRARDPGPHALPELGVYDARTVGAERHFTQRSAPEDRDVSVEGYSGMSTHQSQSWRKL